MPVKYAVPVMEVAKPHVGSVFRVTKTYGHDLGLSAVFRQYTASSHCNKLHGYALSFKVDFEADGVEVDDRNFWVTDFGGLKAFKQFLIDTFDHKTVVSSLDPMLEDIKPLHDKGVIDLVIVDGPTSCEGFAKIAADWILTQGYDTILRGGNVRLVSVECREHSGNSAIYMP